MTEQLIDAMTLAIDELYHQNKQTKMLLIGLKCQIGSPDNKEVPLFSSSSSSASIHRSTSYSIIVTEKDNLYNISLIWIL